MSTVIERTERLTAAPASGLAAVLDIPLPDLDSGLPPLWHWMYFLAWPARSVLGPDGHPLTGELPSPPEPGLLRMFAGGRVHIAGGLLPEQNATRNSRVVSTQHKQGKSGPLTIVTVSHEIQQGDRVVITEEQDIVYREAAPHGQPGNPAPPSGPIPAIGPSKGISEPADALSRREFAVDPMLLFRFSALTHNSHRIHYDRSYAMGVEGYPGLVVHGPLQALLMAEEVRPISPTSWPASFEFRLIQPLFDHQGLILTVRMLSENSLGVTTADSAGRITATGVFRAGA